MSSAGGAGTFTERVIEGKALSLVWDGDDLVDRAGGGARFLASAITEPEGEFSVIYTRLGIKGLLLRHGELLRELN